MDVEKTGRTAKEETNGEQSSCPEQWELCANFYIFWTPSERGRGKRAGGNGRWRTDGRKRESSVMRLQNAMAILLL